MSIKSVAEQSLHRGYVRLECADFFEESLGSRIDSLQFILEIPLKFVPCNLFHKDGESARSHAEPVLFGIPTDNFPEKVWQEGCPAGTDEHEN